MKTNPVKTTRLIAASLSMIAWPCIAQEAPATEISPEASQRMERMMRESRDRLEQEPNRASSDFSTEPWRIGLTVEPIDAALRNHLDIPENTGAMVTRCIENGPAARAGIKQNDIILSANGRPIASIEPLRESVEASAKAGKDLSLGVVTKGVRRTVVIKPDRPKPPMDRPNADRTPPPFSNHHGTPPLEARLGEQEKVIRRMAGQNIDLMKKMTIQKEEMKKMQDAIERLTKAVREMNQESKDRDSN
jgi:membrane-associated protease RseP (regulator of RpoE activity)